MANYFRCDTTFIKSEISYKKKIRMILQGCFPVLFAKRQIRKNSKGLKKDLMK